MKAASHFDATRGVMRLGQRAFTMVEIALCLGIIAFALVAIIGVLPTGFEVQKKNRDETIINQDGMLLLEAIRSGARGFDDLTNHIESITIARGFAEWSRAVRQAGGVPSISGGSLAGGTLIYTNGPASGSLYRLTNSQEMIGLLSTPKYVSVANGSGVVLAPLHSQVTAQVRSITGLAGEKSRQVSEMAFRYQAIVDIEPFVTAPLPVFGRGASADRESANEATWLHQNLYEVRLTLRWPLFDRGGRWEVGRNRKTFRTLVSGQLEPLRPVRSPHVLFFFEPNSFAFTNSLVPLL